LKMDETLQYDVIIIGAGIGGYVAAIRSAQLGKKVAIIEKNEVGGTCVNWGCIPTKALLRTAELLELINNSENYGIHLGDISIEPTMVFTRKDEIVNRLIKGIHYLIKKNNIHLIEGIGTIYSKNQVQIVKSDGKKEKITTENIIIATGSKEPRPQFTVDKEKILTICEALKSKTIPKSLAIVGGNIIGLELAVIFKALGSNVKIIESESNLLPTLDKDISRLYLRLFKKKGIEIYLNAKVLSIKEGSHNKQVLNIIMKDSKLSIMVEKVLISENRIPLSRDLGLEEIGIQMENDYILVNKQMKTNIQNIYAVGDVTGGKMLAHVAAAEGIVAAENIAKCKSTINYGIIPVCIYCQPEAASIGLSEDEAKKQEYEVIVGKIPLLANGRSLTLGETDGFLKIVCDAETTEILGVHIVSSRATDLISEAILAIYLECTAEDIAELMHPHPTISEALMEASKVVLKKAIHI
jgi:dihydrolipoamide dehydrogenase